MFTNQEQFSAAAKANFEAQIAALTTLTNHTFDSVTKIVDLNLNVVKASLEESTATAKQLLAAKDAQEFFAVTSAQAKPTADKAIAYGRTLAGIASSTQAEIAKATEAQIVENSRKAIELVDSVSKNAPAGSEQAIALVKSAIGNATAGYEQLSKTAKQAADTLQNNVNATVEQFSQNAGKIVARAKK